MGSFLELHDDGTFYYINVSYYWECLENYICNTRNLYTCYLLHRIPQAHLFPQSSTEMAPSVNG